MSNRKKWKWIFFSFAIVVFISIAVSLVFFEKHKKEDNINSDDETSNPAQQTEIYATSFSLNIPDSLEILLNNKIKLKSGYVNITPAKVIEKLTYEITRKSGADINGITFESDTITANSLGSYSIKFKVPKSDSSNFSKTINITVYDDETVSHIYQKKNSLIVGESKNINDLFSISNESNYKVETDSKISVLNGVINPITVGDSNIIFTFTENYIQYLYNFKLTIDEQPIYEIVILNGTNNTIEIDFDDNPYAKIHYEIVNREQGHVEQDVTAVSYNEDVVKIETYTEPYINILAIGLGETTITITYSYDNSVKVEVKIIVK